MARECRPLMVCAHCGSETHPTNHTGRPKYCAMCKTPGHRQKSGSCPFRECSKCKEVGHSARECGKRNVRAIENDADAQSIHDANDKDADNCAMSVDGQSDDGNHLSERSDGDRHKESDRSNPSNASGHKNDDNDDTSDAGSEQASIATNMQDESEDDERIVLRHDAQNTMLSERLTSDEDDDSGDDEEDVDNEHADVPVCSSCENSGHKTRGSHKCPNHICTKCKEPGHNQSNCPTTQCTFCGLFGHARKRDCKYQHCSEVEVDWLNILFAVSTRHTIDAQFAKDTCTINPNELRIDGRFKEFSDWDHVERTCVSIDAEALMQLKRIARDFKNDVQSRTRSNAR